MRVFVSYRRDDAAGHAGRLADDLAERMPGATVFQDVDSIGPGADFVAAIQQAIAGADAVLVVIGPEWATIGEPGRGPRLGEPGDVVRLEVRSALEQGKWVIPVLVGNAVVPEPATLPADIASLTHRNAVEVRPEAWDADVARLVAALAPRARASPAASTAPSMEGPAPRSGSRRWVGPVVAAGILLVVAVAVRAWNSSSDTEDGTTSDDVADTVDPGGPTPAGDGDAGRPLELPTPAGTLLHGETGARLGVDVVSATLSDGPQPVLALRTHITNPWAHDAYLDAGDLRLEADGRSISPRNDTGIGIVSRTEFDLPLTFDLAAAPEELVLLVRFWDDVGEIPLLGPRTTTTADPPQLGTDPSPAAIAEVELQIGPASIQTFSDRFVVSVPVAVTNRGRYDMNFWTRSFRMLVDGEMAAPVSDLNEIVAGGSTGDAVLEWDVPLDVRELVFRVDDWGGSAEVTLTEPG